MAKGKKIFQRLIVPLVGESYWVNCSKEKYSFTHPDKRRITQVQDEINFVIDVNGNRLDEIN